MTARLISTLAVIGLATIGAAIVAAVGFILFGGWNAEAAAAAARFTARFSFVWFIIAWSASSLTKLWPGGWRTILLRRRRAVGLGFAAAHFVHLAALLAAVLIFATPRSDTTIFGGSFGYVMVALMALTSNDWSVRTLGPRNWKMLHVFGGVAIAAIFFVSYLGRLDTKPWLAIPALSLLGGAVVLKLAAWVKGAWRARAA